MNMTPRIRHTLGILLAYLFISPSFAGAPLWTIEPLTPTAVDIYGNQSANVQYRVTNQSTKPHQLQLKPMQGVTQITGGGRCAEVMNLPTQGASCILSLLIDGAQLTSAIHEGPILCQQGGGNNQCYRPAQANLLQITPHVVNTPALAYIANAGSNSISICPVASNGGLESCGSVLDATFSSPEDIVLNHAMNRAYIANDGTNIISICSIDASGLIITSCNPVDIGSLIDFVGLNPSNTILYATAFSGNQIVICSINPDGTLVTPCPTSNGNGTFNFPNGRIGFNPGGTHAYVPNNGNNTVSICPVQSNGMFGTCVASNGNSTFNEPLGADLNSSGTMLYVANTGNTVSMCPIQADGSLGTCTTSAGNNSFNFFVGPINLFASDNRFIYVPNDSSDTISICSILSDDTLGLCIVSSDPTFFVPTSVWINHG